MIDVADKLLARWGATSSREWTQEDQSKMLAISIGLGGLFNEDAEAEKAWMNTYNRSLDCRPLYAVLAGRPHALDDVLDQVKKECNP